MMDSDDEVRDRATFYMNVLQQKQKALNAAYIFNGTHSLLYNGVCVSCILREQLAGQTRRRRWQES